MDENIRIDRAIKSFEIAVRRLSLYENSINDEFDTSQMHVDDFYIGLEKLEARVESHREHLKSLLK